MLYISISSNYAFVSKIKKKLRCSVFAKKDVYNNCNSIFMVSNVSVTFIFFILFYAGSWNTKLLIFLHPDIS